MIKFPTYNKPKYIRKYDYLRSFYQPISEWFYDIKELSDYIHELTLEEIKKNKSITDIDTDDTDASDEDNEIDGYEIFRQVFDKLKHEKNKKEIDDPKFIEGRIIDQISKEFISSKFSNHEVIDFDNNNDSLENQAEQTIKLVNANKNLVLFQPVFIFNGAIAKPDTLIITDNKITLIETKGTSMTKINHLFDLFYQSQIVNGVLDQYDKYVNHFQLCVLKYDLAQVKKTNFVLIDKANLSKGPLVLPGFYKKEKLSKFSSRSISIKAALRESNLPESYSDTDFDNIIYNVPSKFVKNGKDYAPSDWDEKREHLTDKAFWQRIDLLKNHKQMNLIFYPFIEYKSFLKNNDYWLELRDYFYFSNKYLAAAFSGNFVPYKTLTKIDHEKVNNIDTLYSYLKQIDELTGRFDIYYRYINANSSDYVNNEIWSFKPNEIKVLFNKLKSKKVYFDFESLNLGLRVIDNTPPFMQTVNQVSIVMDHGDRNLEIKPYVVIDPLKGSNGIAFTGEDYKIIIDALLPSKNLEECKQYSYVVFNKSFEKTRLEEMAEYINEPEYTEKVRIINNNIYDLADLFTITSENSKNPHPFIVFKELKGYYSIKKVLPLVNKYDQEDFIKTGCKDYKLELEEIHNGVEAQTASAKRFFNLLNDEQWEKTKHNLGLYCNNDVLAMVAIEYFVEKIINKKL